MATRKVYYHGPSREGVDVAMPDNGQAHVGWGEALDTDDEHADSLLEQTDNWQKSKPTTDVDAAARRQERAAMKAAADAAEQDADAADAPEGGEG